MIGLYESYILAKQPKSLDDALVLFDEKTKSLDSSSPHIVEWSWVSQNLCWCERRRYLIRQLEDYIAALTECNLTVQVVFIGGSFVSKKDEPKDIDALLIYRAGEDFDPARLACLAVAKVAGLDVRMVPSDTGLTALLKTTLFYSILFQGRKGGEGAIMIMA